LSLPYIVADEQLAYIWYEEIPLLSPYVSLTLTVFGRPFVKRFALCCGTIVLSCQTVERIKMKLGVQVGLGPGHIVLDGDPAPPKGAQPPDFWLCPLWPNFRTISHGKPRPRRHCVRWGQPSPPKKGSHIPNFRPLSIVAKRSPISATADLLLFMNVPVPMLFATCNARPMQVVIHESLMLLACQLAKICL